MNKIPKILHLYWDNSPMSALQVVTVTSFHELNPDWEINVYQPKQEYVGQESYVPMYTGKDYFNLVRELPFVNIKEIDLDDFGIDSRLHNILRSDIFRYHILYRYGGVWSDFDVIWVKPMVQMLHLPILGRCRLEEMESAVCLYKYSYGFHNISIMLSSVGCSFIKSLIDECNRIQEDMEISTLEHQSFGTSMLNGLYETIYDVIRRFPKVVGLAYKTFYPYSINRLRDLYVNAYPERITKNVMAIHWFNGHDLSQEYAHGGLRNYRSSLNIILKNKGICLGN